MSAQENFTDGAIDLAAVKQAADEATAAAEAAKLRDLQLRAASWDRAMTRTFKGIVPAPERRRQLERAIARPDDQA